MQIHTIVPYNDGQHGKAFYVLADDDEAFMEFLTIIGTSPEVDWFSVDELDGYEEYEKLHVKLYNIYHSLRPTITEEE